MGWLSRAEDVYARRAKKEGYPARSVYKLVEIQERFHIFGASSRVLDIGCAPGSWSAYILRHLDKGTLVGVDLEPVIIGFDETQATFLRGDIMDFSAEIAHRGPYDAIVCDVAPKTTGNRLVDTGRSFALVEVIGRMAFDVLKLQGNLVVKIFQGGEERELVSFWKHYFQTVKRLRPKAVRRESCETYLIGLCFKGRRGL